MLHPRPQDSRRQGGSLRALELLRAFPGARRQLVRCLPERGQVSIEILTQTLPLPQMKLQHGAEFEQETRREGSGPLGKEARGIQGGGRQVSDALGVPHNGLDLVVMEDKRSFAGFDLKRHGFSSLNVRDTSSRFPGRRLAQCVVIRGTNRSGHLYYI